MAEHREPVAVSKNASKDPRFQFFHELPEDTYEAFLSVPLMSRGRVVGVINLQHRRPHVHNQKEIRLISTVGFLVGAEIEMARLESENTHLSQKLETRKIVERAKGILQRDLSLDEEQAYLALAAAKPADAEIDAAKLPKRLWSPMNCGAAPAPTEAAIPSSTQTPSEKFAANKMRKRASACPLPHAALLARLRIGDRTQPGRLRSWHLRPWATR